jgi:hypothetical protein
VPEGSRRQAVELGLKEKMLCTSCFLAGAITGIVIFIIVANMIIEG